MNKIKVLQIIDSLNPGGAEMMAVNIANGLSISDNVISYICTTREEGLLKEKISKNVNYIFLNKKSALDIKSIKKLYNFIKKEDITIIHAHSSSFFIGYLIKLLIPKLKLIWHDHYGKSNELGNRKYKVLRIASEKFDSSIAVNKLLKEWANQYLKNKKTYLLSNFAILTENKRENKTTLKGVSGKRIVCLANFRPQKDHLNLLNAFKNVVSKHSDWTLHLVGLDLKDDYSKSITNYIQQHQLTDTVYTYHDKTDILNILKQSTIGVLASKSEGLPVTLLEYGLAKLAVITTDVGDCSKVIKNNLNGFVVPSKNATQLALKINELIEDDVLKDKFGENLFEEVQKNYSEEAYLKKLLAVYLN